MVPLSVAEPVPEATALLAGEWKVTSRFQLAFPHTILLIFKPYFLMPAVWSLEILASRVGIVGYDPSLGHGMGTSRAFATQPDRDV